MTRKNAKDADPIEHAIEAALQPDRFIGYSTSSSFVSELEAVEADIKQLIGTAPDRAATLYEVFLAGCYEKAEEIDDSLGHFGMFVESLVCGWVKARQAGGADADDTAGRLLAWMDNDPYGFCYHLERPLVKVVNKQGLAAFERRIRERFEAPPTALDKHDENTREGARRHWAEILRAILEAQRKVEAYVTLCEQTELTAQDCLTVAKLLQARRKLADALGWVRRGLAIDKRTSSATAGYEFAKLERELLQKLGRGDEALDAAWVEFKAHPSKYSYEDLMRYVPKKERAAWHAKAMGTAAGADLHSLIELWLETKEIDRLVERLRTASDAEIEGISHYTTEPVARRLAKTYPAVAAKVYRAVGMRILNAKKSKYYDAALSNLEDAKRCYEKAGLGVTWSHLVQEIRRDHYRKAGFMGRFEELVTGQGPSAKPSFLERAKARWPPPSGT
jgi:tetratricopeptide (TPR) repeat protein